jgi:hypothetical protein
LKKNILVLAIVVVAGFYLLHHKAKTPNSSEPVESTDVARPSSDEDRDSHATKPVASPQLRPTAITSSESPSPNEPVRSKGESLPLQQKPNLDTAPQIAWENANSFSKDMRPPDPLPPSHAPPTANEAKKFRGFVFARPTGDSRTDDYDIEMRFQNGKWIVSEGVRPGQMTEREPRDLISFKGHSDQWVLYYDNSERFFLQHFDKMNISDLTGDREVLSGWLLNETQLWFLAMISVEQDWPSKNVIKQLVPNKPDHYR